MTARPMDPLPEADQRRGRRVAVASHAFGMTYRTAITGDLATQALVTLGASEAAIGLQVAVTPFAFLVQLPGLRLLGRLGKGRLLLVTQLVAVLAGIPLLAFAQLRDLDPALGSGIAIASLSLVSLCLVLGSTAWWPLLHGFVAAERTGRFFAVLRLVWHATLIAFFLFCTWWLHHHVGSFGALFALAWAAGAVRAGLIPLFPERREPPPPGAWEAMAKVLRPGPLRRYLLGVSLDQVVYRSVPAFAIVMLRREVGLGEAQAMVTTLALYGGGLLAVYPAGRIVHRFGTRPVLLSTCWLRGLAIGGLGLTPLLSSHGEVLAAVAALFLVYALLTAAFGVAEIQVLFSNTPAESPSAVIVATVVGRNLVASVVPLASGLVLDRLLEASSSLAVYGGFFAVMGALQVAAAAPLSGRDLGRRAEPMRH